MPTTFRFNTKALQTLRDKIRRRITRSLFDRPPRAHNAVSNRIVFVRWDGKLGDSIVLSWVYRELARVRPDLPVTVLTHADLASMHSDDFSVQHVIVCSKRPGLWEILKLSRRVRHARYVVHLTEAFKPRDFLFVRCVGPAHVVGLDDAVQSVDIKLGALTENLHFSQKLLPWLESLGVQNPDMSYIVPQASATIAQLQREWPEGTVIGFCPAGAGSGRRLSDSRIRELLLRMRACSDNTIVILPAPDHRVALQVMLDDLADSKLRLAPETGDLAGLFASIRLCDAIVSVDTAVVHIASGLKKPQLALYNPDRIGHVCHPSWHPNAATTTTLFAQVTDPQVIDAIDDQQFEEAFQALLTRLAER